MIAGNGDVIKHCAMGTLYIPFNISEIPSTGRLNWGLVTMGLAPLMRYRIAKGGNPSTGGNTSVCRFGSCSF